MKKILILSTDTAHHRYFINRIIDEGVPVLSCIFETTSVSPPFVTGPFYDAEQNDFEKKNFFRTTGVSLDRVSISGIENINSPEACRLISSLGPDFGVVFGNRKLSAEVISLFPDGLINIHRGISQEYRGLDSDLWAIYHSDYSNLGVTLHRVDSSLDTGDIIYQERLKVKKNMKIYQLRYYTSIIATDLTILALEDYLNGRLSGHPQKKGRYYSFMPLVLKEIVAEKFHKYSGNLQ